MYLFKLWTSIYQESSIQPFMSTLGEYFSLLNSEWKRISSITFSTTGSFVQYIHWMPISKIYTEWSRDHIYSMNATGYSPYKAVLTNIEFEIWSHHSDGRWTSNSFGKL